MRPIMDSREGADKWFESEPISRRDVLSRKTMLMIGMVVGSTAGSAAPALWGADLFSLWSIFLGLLGGVAGIWFAYKMTV